MGTGLFYIYSLPPSEHPAPFEEEIRQRTLSDPVTQIGKVSFLLHYLKYVVHIMAKLLRLCPSVLSRVLHYA